MQALKALKCVSKCRAGQSKLTGQARYRLAATRGSRLQAKDRVGEGWVGGGDKAWM